MVINARKKIITFGILLLAVSVFFPLARADQAAVATAIASAKERLVACYRAAEDAESAGANVTSLVAVLNDAGLLLSLAEYAYSIGDFEMARDYAAQSQGFLGNFVAEANVLKEEAVKQRSWDFLINVVGSVVGVFVVLGAGVAVWVFLKRKYEKAGVHVGESSGV
ncbi:MAG: hypothetical protein QXZ70_07805 [Candidatus Bathyarchaeia archaeon]